MSSRNSFKCVPDWIGFWKCWFFNWTGFIAQKMFVVCIALIFLFGAGGGKGLDVGIRVCFSSLYVVLCLSFDADFYTLSTAESIKIRL